MGNMNRNGNMAYAPLGTKCSPRGERESKSALTKHSERKRKGRQSIALTAFFLKKHKDNFNFFRTVKPYNFVILKE